MSSDRTPSPNRFLQALWALVAVTSLATVVAMQPGSLDVFRAPKDIALFICAMVLLAFGGTAVLLSDDVLRSLRRLQSPAVMLALAACVWAIVVSLASVRPNASFWAPFTVISFAIFFCAALLTASHRPVIALLVALVPAMANAILATLQSSGTWFPWEVDPRIPMRLRTTGFIGNPNDLGSYLVIPMLAALAAGLVWKHHRWLLVVALVLVGGLASAQSVTPFIAAAAGIFVMTLTSKTRRVRFVVIGAVAALILAASLHPASRARFQSLKQAAQSGQLPEMTSFRIVPAVTAFQMFRERPLTGMGPGAFSSMYMTYKLPIDEKYPQWLRLGNESFNQVHNDHMQLLAETGFPGYLLFLGALVLLAQVSFRTRNDDDERTQFARFFAFPAAASFGVLALAQFPLQLTAPMIPMLYFAALCFAWSRSDA